MQRANLYYATETPTANSTIWSRPTDRVWEAEIHLSRPLPHLSSRTFDPMLPLSEPYTSHERTRGEFLSQLVPSKIKFCQLAQHRCIDFFLPLRWMPLESFLTESILGVKALSVVPTDRPSALSSVRAIIMDRWEGKGRRRRRRRKGNIRAERGREGERPTGSSS